MSTTSWHLDGTERSRLAFTVHHAMRDQLGPLTLGFDFGAGWSMPDCAELEPVVLALLELEPGRLVGSLQLEHLPDWIDTDAIELAQHRQGFARCHWRATQARACGTFTLDRTTGDLWSVHAHAQLYRPHHHH